MQIVTDMGAHAAFVWPAYAAFIVIFGALGWWAISTNARARTRLSALEVTRTLPDTPPEPTTGTAT